MFRHDSRRAAFNHFPLTTAEMVTVKLRTFGFLAVVLLGLLLSSCAVAPRPAAVSAPAAAGAAGLNITQSIPGNCGRHCIGRCARRCHYSFHRQYVHSANALNALAMNKGLEAVTITGYLTAFTVDDHSICKPSRLTKPEAC
jgi:hypothetical protein